MATQNEIPKKLTQEPFFRLWAASDRLYARAKLVLKVRMVLVVATPVALSFLALSDPVMQSWVALYSVLITACDAVIPYYIIKSLKETAAKIQDKFDCDVLGMEWNERRVGRPPAEEEVSCASRGSCKDDAARKRVAEWYPSQVGQLPLPAARVLCQRANVTWDSGLRKRYAWGIRVALIVLGLAVVVTAFWLRMDMRDVVLSVLVPALPLFMWLIREQIQQNESANMVLKIRDDAKELWERVLNEDLSEPALMIESRHLQDMIFEHRKSNTPVPDIFYKLFRTSHEDSMVEATEVLIRKYIEKKPSTLK